MYNNYDDWEIANCQADKPKEWEELENKLEYVTASTRYLISMIYSKEPLQENDLEEALGFLADTLDLRLPDGQIQIARKSQALMDLQRYLLTLNEK